MAARGRVDRDAELSEVRRDATEESYVPTGSGRYMERQIEGDPGVRVDAEGHLSYTTETGQ